MVHGRGSKQPSVSAVLNEGQMPAGESGFYGATAMWAHEDPVIVFLTIEGETLETTPNHPFYTAVGEWVQAGSLQPGDEIRDAAWGTGTVEAITFLATPKRCTISPGPPPTPTYE